MSRGVIIVAAGDPIYGEYAFNLAASLKYNQPNLGICVVHTKDSLSTLSKEHLDVFSHFVEVEPDKYYQSGTPQYQKLKVQLNNFTPFDKTLYLDADGIWFKKSVVDVFDSLLGKDFVIQSNGYYDPAIGKETRHGYFYWGDPAKMCTYYGGHPGKLPKA